MKAILKNQFSLLHVFTAVVLSFATVGSHAYATEPPKHVQPEIRAAEALLATPHISVDAWPGALQEALGKTLRTANPINTPADFQAVLQACPESFAPRQRFGEVFEFGGWFFASLDSTKEPLWIFGALVKKGTHEICFFSHW